MTTTGIRYSKLQSSHSPWWANVLLYNLGFFEHQNHPVIRLHLWLDSQEDTGRMPLLACWPTKVFHTSYNFQLINFIFIPCSQYIYLREVKCYNRISTILLELDLILEFDFIVFYYFLFLVFLFSFSFIFILFLFFLFIFFIFLFYLFFFLIFFIFYFFIFSERFGSVRFGTVRFGPVWFGPDRFGLVQSGSVRSGPDRFGSVRFGSVRFGSGRFGSVRESLKIRCKLPSVVSFTFTTTLWR
jgi:hypothetical protein